MTSVEVTWKVVDIKTQTTYSNAFSEEEAITKAKNIIENWALMSPIPSLEITKTIIVRQLPKQKH